MLHGSHTGPDDASRTPPPAVGCWLGTARPRLAHESGRFPVGPEAAEKRRPESLFSRLLGKRLCSTGRHLCLAPLACGRRAHPAASYLETPEPRWLGNAGAGAYRVDLV